MPQLNLTFDLGSETVTRATIDGREVGVADVVSVVLMKGMAKLATLEGGNLLAEYAGPSRSLAQAQLDIAQAFGYQGETTGVEGPQS